MPTEVLALTETAHGEERGWRKGQELIDALPYIDELTPEYRVAVDKLLEEELSTSGKKPGDFLPELPPLPRSRVQDGSIVAAELERVQRGEPMQAMDVQRYDLPVPTDDSLDNWQKAVDNARSQLEHQYTRLLNLELLIKFGADSWRARNDTLSTLVDSLKAELKTVEQKTEDVNRRRKLMQVSAGEHLRQLQERYRQLFAKNREITAACISLESEVAALQS